MLTRVWNAEDRLRPRPRSGEKRVQTSDWKALDGAGDLEGITGDGQMEVHWNEVGGLVGRETFTGEVVLPSD